MRLFLALILTAGLLTGFGCLAEVQQTVPAFTRALSEYPVTGNQSIGEVLASRFHAEPFNLVASVIFLLAIIHTFLAPFFTRLSHRYEEEHRIRTNDSDEVSF